MAAVMFSGCSYVAGGGWPKERDDPNLWVNILHRESPLSSLDLHNRSVNGRSNAGIFLDAVSAMTATRYEWAFVCWTSVPRYELALGWESYTTQVTFSPNMPNRDHNLNGISYPKKYLDSIRDRFCSLVHEHYEIVQIVRYCKALLDLADLQQTKLYFINSICPWDSHYFARMIHIIPNLLTPYTQRLLHTDNRDDDEISLLYHLMHDQYDAYGNIHPDKWINLYNSFASLKVDTNSDNCHPGPTSNQLFSNLVKQTLWPA